MGKSKKQNEKEKKAADIEAADAERAGSAFGLQLPKLNTLNEVGWGMLGYVCLDLEPHTDIVEFRKHLRQHNYRIRP